MDVAVADADSEKASGAIFAVQSVQRKRLVVTCYAKLPSFVFIILRKLRSFSDGSMLSLQKCSYAT